MELLFSPPEQAGPWKVCLAAVPGGLSPTASPDEAWPLRDSRPEAQAALALSRSSQPAKAACELWMRAQG